MRLSDGEKLILMMLCDVYEKLGIKECIEPKVVREAIYSGNLWGLSERYPGIFDNAEKSRATVDEVGKILDMWFIIETSHARLATIDKDKITKAEVPFKSVKFPGFDGNDEGAHRSIALFYINQLDLFSHFKGRGDLNSHMPSIDSYRRMFRAYEMIRPSLVDRQLTADEIIQLLEAAVHPSLRR